MPENSNKLEALKGLLSRKKSKGFYAWRLGITIAEVEDLMMQLGKPVTIKNSLYSGNNEEKSFLEDFKSGTAETSFRVYDEIHNLEELIEKANINTDIWEITKYIQNYWGNSKTPYYQVKAWLQRKKVNQAEAIQCILENYKSNYKPLSKSSILLNHRFDKKTMVEISLADYHIDKLDLNNMTIEEKSEKYLEILDNLIYRCYSGFHIDEIVFIAGNDWFNNDNYQGGTTSMTPQTNSCSWDKAYEVGFDTLVKAISKLKQFCNTLKITLVAGNHAKTKEFYLVHGLQAYFKDEKSIIFDRTSAPRKINVWGNTLIGYHHGNCKIDDLPLILATEFYEEWGKCKFKEIHTGDKHFYMEKEIKGVRVKQMPSLTNTDNWHNENNFIGSLRAGIALVYDYEKGRVAEFEERL